MKTIVFPAAVDSISMNAVFLNQPVMVTALVDCPEVSMKKGESGSIIAVNPHQNAYLVRRGMHRVWYKDEDFSPINPAAGALLKKQRKRAGEIIKS